MRQVDLNKTIAQIEAAKIALCEFKDETSCRRALDSLWDVQAALAKVQTSTAKLIREYREVVPQAAPIPTRATKN